MKINAYNIDERDRRFSPYRIPYTAEAEAVVAEVLTQVRKYELKAGLRKRGRRQSAHDNLMAALTALVSDLMHRAVTSEKFAGRIHLSRRTARARKTRYQAAFEGKPVIEAIDLLCTLDLAKLVVRGQYVTGLQSAYIAGPKLITQIEDTKIQPESLALKDDEEIVILKDAKLKGDLATAAEKRGLWIDYEECDQSRSFRVEVHTINEYLINADIDYSGNKIIDLTNRRQRRYFNNASFMEGGRLFGGFWLTDLSRKARKYITIDGWQVVELDFKSMMPSLAYANNGLSIPEDFDPYTIPGLRGFIGDPGDNPIVRGPTDYRTGVKRLFGALMFSESKLKNWPKGIREENFRGIAMKLPEILAAIKAHNAPIADLFERGAGHHYHFEESELIVDILLECIDRGVVALQIHDGLLVAHSKVKEVQQIMLDKFQARHGQKTVVTSSAPYLLRRPSKPVPL